MSQQFTLRSHNSSITFIYPSPTSSLHLYTADSTGLIIEWDLITRRPVISWQAHNDTILSMSTIHNHLLTHSRDNTIKIWNNTDCIMEIPCNSLNFSNVVVVHDEILITPASINSNNLDVYKITSDWQLTRLISDINVYQLVEKGIQFEEIGSRNDYGIIMKIHLVDNIIYVGFESGDIVGLELILPKPTVKENSNIDKLIINQSPKLIVKYHNSIHVPNPIVSMSTFQDILVSGSTTNKIVIHKHPVEIIKVTHSGVQSIVNYKNEYLIIGFWNGEIRYDEKVIKRDVPMIQNNDNDDRSKSIKKLTFMTLLVPQKVESTTTGKNKYSQLIRGKKILTTDTLLVGYEDGSIVAYKV
ncbi:ASTRA-associated protein 1 [Candida tropicalis]